MSRPRVVLAVSPPVEESIKQLLFGPDVAVEVAATVPDPAALERILDDTTDIAAVLVSGDQPGLTSALLTRARAQGPRLVGIATGEQDTQALRRLPLDSVLRTPLDAATLESAMTDPGDAAGAFPTAAPIEAPPGAGSGEGTVVAVVGARRSPGASELAASLAALAAAEWPAILVELDLLGGGLALQLGADSNHGSFQGLVRATRSDERGVRELIERWLVTVPGWPPVLLAPPRRDRAMDELDRPGVIRNALETLARLYSPVVVDVGFLLGASGNLGPVERGHREALVTADAVVLVLGAREAQLDASLAQLDLLRAELEIPAERLRIVCNAVGGPGAVARPQLDQTLTAALADRGLAVDALIPWDNRALAKATRTGHPLAAAHPRGPYARSLRRLIDGMFLPAAPVTRSRKRLLPRPTSAAPAPVTTAREKPSGRDEEVALPWRS